LKRLFDETETGLSRPNSRRMMVMMWKVFVCLFFRMQPFRSGWEVCWLNFI